MADVGYHFRVLTRCHYNLECRLALAAFRFWSTFSIWSKTDDWEVVDFLRRSVGIWEIRGRYRQVHVYRCRVYYMCTAARGDSVRHVIQSISKDLLREVPTFTQQEKKQFGRLAKSRDSKCRDGGP
ncbi:hypothetical protein NDU88_004435 [Pleurodeles waltl]|uniref:Uncharacterized protein n=1 Tax=Pleurodeles waltl TaxID=8319 RepID=A0AAV7QCK9_PLEWA|nr:hypothetical protein NDU88_004435 [Pleurodeles waltl]